MKRPIVLALALACSACTAPIRLSPYPRIDTTSVGLVDGKPDETLIGGLRYRGGVAIMSTYPLFGGLSSLRWDNGYLYALSDENMLWLKLAPVERDGRLVGARMAGATRLAGPDGRLMSGKSDTDAESFELVRPPRRKRPDSVTIGFERHDRLWNWRLRNGLPFGRPRVVPVDADWFARQPRNMGVEALAGDRDSALMVSEGLRTASGDASALYARPGLLGARIGTAVEIGVAAPGEERPSDLVQAAPGCYVMLRRSWSPERQFRVVMEAVRLDTSTAIPTARTHLLARFAAPVITDNFEGVAIRKEGDKSFIYIVSDDNFEKDQRTLLLKFELLPGAFDF